MEIKLIIFYICELNTNMSEQNKKIIDEPILLWENKNISAEFSAQTISLDLTDYSKFVVLLKGAPDSEAGEYMSFYCLKGIKTNMEHCMYIRQITIKNNGVVFGSASEYNVEYNDNAMIPYRVYAI